MYQRIQSPSLQELQTRVADLLGATQVVVQFSAPEQYPPEVLAALNALCERHGDRLEVRFYGHYFGQAFDGNTLLALPQVQALTLDCLSQVERLERLESLQNLKCLAIGIDKLDLNPLLASRNLHALNRLRVFQEVGPKLDLKALSHMPNLCGLHLNAKAHSLQPVATLAGLTELSLYRQPASTTFEVVAQLPDLHRLDRKSVV